MEIVLLCEFLHFFDLIKYCLDELASKKDLKEYY